MIALKFLEHINLGKRRPGKAGDLFAYRIRGVYRFGRIVRDDLPYFTGLNVAVVYFYQPGSESPGLVPSLSQDDLLMPPYLFHPDCWRYGHFILIRRQPLKREEMLSRHVFRRGGRYGYFCDENGKACEPTDQPTNLWAISHLVVLDWDLGTALGYFESEAEYDALPDLPAVQRKRPRNEPVGGHIEIPHEELSGLNIDISQIEFPIAEALIRGRIGDWVETGSDAEQRHIVFMVHPRKIGKFAEVVQMHLRSLGIRRYRIYNEETGEELV